MTTAEAHSRKIPAKVLVTNISQKKGGAGCFLDPGQEYGNRILGPGRSMTIDCPGGVLPELIHIWGDKVSVHNAENGADVLGSVNGEITPGQISPTRPMAGMIDGDPKKGDFFLDEEEPDLDGAIDAAMPHSGRGEHTGPIAGDLRQQSGPGMRAKVSLGRREEEIVGAGLSPIPGDVPRDLDNSQQYTIRAPRATHVGGVVGKK